MASVMRRWSENTAISTQAAHRVWPGAMRSAAEIARMASAVTPTRRKALTSTEKVPFIRLPSTKPPSAAGDQAVVAETQATRARMSRVTSGGRPGQRSQTRLNRPTRVSSGA